MNPFSEIVRDVRERLNAGPGDQRSAPQRHAQGGSAVNQVRQAERALRQAMRRNQTLKPIAHWLLGKRYQAHIELADFRMRLGAKIAGSEAFRPTSTVNPENMIWIFGIGRSGTTWLRDMMRDLSNHQTWDEPLVGKLFGDFYYKETVVNLSRADFIMGDPIRKGWIKSVRNFVLDGAGYSHPRLRPEDFLVIGEHNGSVGAPLLMESMPESRLILLVRDPRDVVASILDGARQGGWIHQWRDKNRMWGHEALDQEEPNSYVRHLAERYLREVGCARRAYSSHKGRKVLLKYEDLRADTLNTMKTLYAALEIPVDGKELEHAVAMHTWESIPDKNKGKGKFHRKATPGGWRADLTTEEAHLIEEITAPLLREFYPT
jgi:sulfotransferase family protein